MKLIILFFLFFSSLLYSHCTSQTIEYSDKLYEQANNEENISRQIELLEASLDACYAPEIEVSLLTLKIEKSQDVMEKIYFHKEILGLLSDFSEEKEALCIQNQCNLQLSLLFQPFDPIIADIYKREIRPEEKTEKQKQKSQNFLYGVLFFLLLLLLWGFFG